MKHYLLAGLLFFTTGAALSQPREVKTSPTPAATTEPALAPPGDGKVGPVKKLALPGKAQSHVVELDPIGGNRKPLPKYGPGWRLDPVVNLPGMGIRNGTGPR